MTIQTHIDAAIARRNEGAEAVARGDHAEAARCFTWAAEQRGHAVHIATWAYGDQTMAEQQKAEQHTDRLAARKAIQRRDEGDTRPRIRLEGRIGGWT